MLPYKVVLLVSLLSYSVAGLATLPAASTTASTIAAAATKTTLQILPPKILSSALGLALALSTALSTTSPDSSFTIENTNNNNNVPVLEVIKVYGKLAGKECYGKQAPKGSSCQINLNEWKTKGSISREEFEKQLEQMEFAWPLKPFGVENSPSLSKTAVMNKGAETYVYLQQLEARNLYDPRNPTGPLPSSLRPALNQKLQSEGILDRRAIDRTYEALLPLLGQDEQDATNTAFLDYYEFLKLFGPNSVSWPKYE